MSPAPASDYRQWADAILARRPAALVPRHGSRERCIVSVATGYPPDLLKPLVRSLRAVSDAALVVAAHDDDGLAAFLAAEGVDHWPVPPAAGYRPYPALARLDYCLAVLDGLPESYRQVMLCDSRDVVFQDEPFAGLPERGISFFVEGAGRAGFGLGSTNGRWLRLMLPRAAVRALRDRPVVNGGVIMGSRAAVTALCRAKLDLCATTREWTRQTTGLDNISTNVLAHSDAVAGTRIVDNHRIVANVYRDTPMRILADSRIASPDGTVCPVVHMYDRRPDLLAHVNRRWGVERALTFDARRSVRRKGEAWQRARRNARLVFLALLGR